MARIIVCQKNVKHFLKMCRNLSKHFVTKLSNIFVETFCHKIVKNVRQKIVKNFLKICPKKFRQNILSKKC